MFRSVPARLYLSPGASPKGACTQIVGFWGLGFGVEGSRFRGLGLKGPCTHIVCTLPLK